MLKLGYELEPKLESNAGLKSWRKLAYRALLVALMIGTLNLLFVTTNGAAASATNLRANEYDLTGLPKPEDLGKSDGTASVTFSRGSNTIHVEGPGEVVTLTDIYTALGKDNQALKHLSPNQWYLNANLLIGREVKLLLHGSAVGGDVDWLKLRSDSSGYIWLKTRDGEISLNATKVTSWDQALATFDTTFYGLEIYESIRDLDVEDLDPDRGRAFVLARTRTRGAPQTRMDITDSELAYLGFAYPQMQGVAWRTPYEVGGVTGQVTGSLFHHNYFGAYTFRAVDMLWRGNEFYENAVHGLHPHDDSNGFLVEGNSFHDNGKDGLIFSVQSHDNVIKGNRSFDNKGHGIVLDIDSDNNLVEGNIIFGNEVGIVLHSSDNNVIRGNTIRNNDRGIRIDTKTVSPAQKLQPAKNGDYSSRNNRVVGNIIEDNRSFAIYSYPPFEYNSFDNNQSSGNRKNGFYRARPNVDEWKILAGIAVVASVALVMGSLILPYLVFGRREPREDAGSGLTESA